MTLTDKSVRDLLTAFGSTDPTPGGGSASALAASIGASLLMMVAGLPKTRGGSDEDRAALAAATRQIATLRAQLTDAIDGDTTAYDQVVAAYRLPKASAEEQAARKAAIQSGLRAATEVPLSVVRLSAAALAQAIVVAQHGYRAAASDVGVAIALLRAGAHGARLNVDVNLGSLTDAVYADAVRGESARLWSDAARDGDEAESRLRST